jgi:hypothetical protein
MRIFWKEITKYGRNREMNERLGNILGESQFECNFLDFPQGKKIILMLLELPGILKKSKWAVARIIK